MAWKLTWNESRGSKRSGTFGYYTHFEVKKGNCHLFIHPCNNVPSTVLMLRCVVSQASCGPDLQRVCIQVVGCVCVVVAARGGEGREEG